MTSLESHNSPVLREDLRIMPHNDSEGVGYIIEDPLRNSFYKIGVREYRFLCFLEQGGELSELEKNPAASTETVSQEEAETILKWLAGKQLLQHMGPKVLQTLADNQQQFEQKGWYNRLNLIIFKLPLFNPDPLLSRFLPWIRWIAGPIFSLSWLLFALAGTITLLSNLEEFVHQSFIFFSPKHLIMIGGIWVALKLLHEFAHAVTCKRYGGRVYETGILFILFFPLTYVNATSSWSFSNRWQRIHVTSAGILAELFVAWIALLYWAGHQGTLYGTIAHNTVIIAGVSSLLFNANPLMRFDGYYLLSDLVALPNLYFLGQEAVRKKVRRWWLGIRDQENASDPPWVILYGLAIYCWRVLVLCSLTLLAAKMFSGWGVVLASIAVISWIIPPLINTGRTLQHHLQQHPQQLYPCLLRLVVTLFIVGFVLFGIRWEKSAHLPGVVMYDEQYSVRTSAAGFIETVLTYEGDGVQAEQPLFQLKNPELVAGVNILNLQLEEIQAKLRIAEAEENYSHKQVLLDENKALQEQFIALQSDLRSLTVTALGQGIIVGRKLERYKGLWVEKGTELCQIINPEHIYLVALMSQDNIEHLPTQAEAAVSIDMSEAGLGTFTGKISRVAPKATSKLVHLGFAAPFGGDLNVKSVHNGEQESYQLLTPHIAVYIALPPAIRITLRDGQRGYITIAVEKISLGTLLQDRFSGWVRDKKQS